MSAGASGRETMRGRFWPSPAQELLLKAALLEGGAAAAAFKQWRARAGGDRLDEGSYRLLPLLGHNLERLGLDDPFLKLCRGVHRHTWVRNQLQLRQAVELLQAMQRERIDVMLLKGAALALAYYDDPGLRPFEDIDLLVPAAQAQPAFEVLSRLGWRPCQGTHDRITREYASVNHALAMVNERGVLLDFHWHLLPGSLDPEADREFWLASELWRGQPAPFRTLGATDQLFHACVHGYGHQVGWERTPPVRWVADALQIMAVHGDRIDTRRLGDLARQHHLCLALQSTLGYLQEHFAVARPVPSIPGMADWPVASWERSEHRCQQKRQGILGALPMAWRHYLRLKHGGSGGQVPKNFAIYLKRRFHAPHPLGLLWIVMNKGLHSSGRWLADIARPRSFFGNP